MEPTHHLRSGEYLLLHASFKEWLILLNYSVGTRQVIPYHVGEFLVYEEGRGRGHVREILPSDGPAFLDYLEGKTGCRTGRPYSPSHLNKYIQALGLLSRYLTETGRRRPGFALQWRRPEAKPPVWLSVAEIEALYLATADTVLGLRDRAMLAVYYGCGLRLSEGAALEVRDVFLDRGLLHVRKGKGYKERLVPVAGQNLRTLEAYLASGRPELVQHPPTEALFLGADRGLPLHTQSLYLRIRQLARKARIQKKVGTHTLRHSIATHLLESGMPLERIRDFLGHASLDSTQLYTHLVKDHP